MNESDLLLVVGASFSNHTGIAPYKPIVQIDDDPAAIGRFHPVTVGLLGDAAVTVRGAARRRAGRDRRGRPARRRRRRGGRSGAPRRPAGSRTTGAGVSRGRGVRRAVRAPARPTPSIAVDVGNHAYSLRPLPRVARGQPVLMSGYLGSIGFGYPAAMGAWAADPARPVVAVTGDGGFGQYLRRADHRGEVRHPDQARAARQRRARQDQQGAARRRRTRCGTPRCVNPDLAEYARLCGATGIRVHRRATSSTRR